jgi:hypothetical protein
MWVQFYMNDSLAKKKYDGDKHFSLKKQQPVNKETVTILLQNS